MSKSAKKASVEEQVTDYYKARLATLGIRYYGQTEPVNDSIDQALKNADSKSGGSGQNFPDIKLLLDRGARRIPVMVEAKGTKGKLEKRTKSGQIELVTYYDKDAKPDEDGNIKYHKGDANHSSVVNYAVNGAVHYANAVLNYTDYTEVIAIGINGTTLDANGRVRDPECRAYYISRKNNNVPRHIPELDSDWTLLKYRNLDRFFSVLDDITLTEQEREELKRQTEITLEARIKSIHQSLYDDNRLKSALTTNEKLYLFCALIMAGLSVEKTAPIQFAGNDNENENDGTAIITRIKSFLSNKQCGNDKIEMILNLLSPVLKKAILWKPVQGESILKNLHRQVKEDIIPCLESNLHLDFMGKILNSLGDWVHIENDRLNDVVLTPRYVTTLMAKLARTDRNSFVWDRAMGSAGFLVSAMDIMIKDAQENIFDREELEKKIAHIKEHQLLGVEILGNIYLLAVLNMILMGDGSSNIYNDDGHKFDNPTGNFPATVFLLNPPYSAEGKGFIFVEETLEKMTEGYACILIQENAGSGNGLPYTRRILKHHTLRASIHMADIFRGKSSVQTAIYVFEVARAHEADDMVTFIDFSNDGYTRQNRRKSSQEVNLRDTDHAAERYAEIEAIVLGKKPETGYYTEANGLVIRDTVTLNGDDWTFAQHRTVDTRPKEADFRKTVADYLAWKTGEVIQNAPFDVAAGFSAFPEPAGYKSFRIGDLFELIHNPQLDKNYFTFSDKGEYPYFTRTENNNGIFGMVEYLDEEHKIPGNTLAVGMISTRFHYMSHDFYAGQFTKTAIPKFDGFNETIAQFFITVLNAHSDIYKGVLVRDFMQTFYNTVVLLPVTASGEPDYPYMEKYICRLELERIHALERYLLKTGLNDYELTDEEREVLKRKVMSGTFSIVSLFDVRNTQSILKENVVFDSGVVPYVTASESNNSVMSYIEADREIIEKGNSILIGGKTMVITYQASDYVSNDSHNLALYLKDEQYRNELTQLFLVSALQKALCCKYHWGDSISRKKIQNDSIILPVTPTGTPDYVYMERYIRALEKSVIREAVLFKDRMIAATRQVVENAV